MNNTQIFDKFSDRLIHFFGNRVQHQEDARDLVQKVFLKIAKNNGNTPKIKNIGAWVFTIANNTFFPFLIIPMTAYTTAVPG